MKKLLLTTITTLFFAFPAHAASTFVDVNGLVCDFCAQALTKVFSKQEAVSDIDVNLDEKLVTINYNDGHSLDDETITKLITDSGYNVVSIRHGESEEVVGVSDGE